MEKIISTGIDRNAIGQYFGYIHLDSPLFIIKTNYCETFEQAERYLKLTLEYLKKYGIKE